MYYIGIDLGGTNIACGVVNEKCEIIYKDSIPTKAQRTSDEIIKDMAYLAMDAAEKSGVGKENVAWVGIGSPGSVDRDEGILLYANNIPFINTPMRKVFQQHWNVPVYIDNDANAAALGEAYAGSAKDCNDAVMITLGTGVGGGIIIDKKIYSGFNSNGAELGHMVIVAGGEDCSCGRKGCWEAYASVSGLIRDTKRAMEKNPDSLMWQCLEGEDKHVSGKTAFVAAKKGDAAGQAVVDKYLEYVAIGVTNYVNIFQPEVLCIGGSISKEGDYLLNPIKEFVERERYTKNSDKQTTIKIALLGNDAGIIGAAMLGK